MNLVFITENQEKNKTKQKEVGEDKNTKAKIMIQKSKACRVINKAQSWFSEKVEVDNPLVCMMDKKQKTERKHRCIMLGMRKRENIIPNIEEMLKQEYVSFLLQHI